MTTTPNPSVSPTGKPRLDSWVWVAVATSAALVAFQARRLVTLAGWERTLPFARDFLPGAIATVAMSLAAYLAIMVLLLLPRWRKWGMTLGIGWGAIAVGVALWPDARNVWYQVSWRLHLTNSLRHIIVVGGPTSSHNYWLAGLSGLLVLSSLVAFVRCPRERLDRGILLASLFYAAFYFLAVGIVARLVIPH